MLLAGGANVDHTGVASTRIVAGQSAPGQIIQSFGGVARNIAETLARLGLACRFVSVVADDEDGRALLDQLNSVGVDTSHCVCVDNQRARTAGFISVVSTSGEVVAQVSDMQVLDTSDQQTFSMLPALMATADLMLIDANLPNAVLELVFSNQREVTIVADAVSPSKCLRLKPWLSSVTLLKANEAEAAALTATPVNTKGYSERLLDALMALGPAEVLLSRGGEGATLTNGRECVSEKAQIASTKTVNLNGTGDALLSGVLAARSAGHNIRRQLQFGQAMAARASLVHGAVNPEIGSNDLSKRTSL